MPGLQTNSSSYSTLPVPYISESCIEIKSYIKFLFSHFLVVPQKGFMKAYKAFIKPFEAPQRSAKLKIQHKFLLFVRDWAGLGRVGLKVMKKE